MTKKQQKAKNAISRVTVNMNLSTKVFKTNKDYHRNIEKARVRKEISRYGYQLGCWYLDACRFCNS